MPVDPLDFSGYETQMLQARSAAVNNVRLRFFYDPQQNRAKSEAAGRPIFDNIEMVSIINPGSRDEFVAPLTDELRVQYSGAYEHWRRTQEQPTDGTPLEMVPFLNPAQIKELRALNIESLEHLAGLSDAMRQRIGMGALELVKKAQAYLGAAKDHAGESKLISENEELRQQLTYAQKCLTEANHRYELLVKGTAPAPSTLSPQVQAAPVIDIQAIAVAVAAVMQGKTPHDPVQEAQVIDAEAQVNAVSEEPRRRRRV